MRLHFSARGTLRHFSTHRVKRNHPTTGTLGDVIFYLVFQNSYIAILTVHWFPPCANCNIGIPILQLFQHRKIVVKDSRIRGNGLRYAYNEFTVAEYQYAFLFIPDFYPGSSGFGDHSGDNEGAKIYDLILLETQGFVENLIGLGHQVDKVLVLFHGGHGYLSSFV